MTSSWDAGTDDHRYGLAQMQDLLTDHQGVGQNKDNHRHHAEACQGKVLTMAAHAPAGGGQR